MKKEKLKEILACPKCQSKLVLQSDNFTCSSCGKVGQVEDSKFVFFKIDTEVSTASGFLSQCKEFIKTRFPKLYPQIIDWISPVYSSRKQAKWTLRGVDDAEKIILNLGSGCSDLSENVINVDIYPYKPADLLASIHSLPIASNSVDIILSIACLEHIEDPQRVVKEMYRILKPGGLIRCAIPFMQGIHGSPDDYQRYTPNGLKTLFKDFSVNEVRVSAGPASTLVWILQEWFAILLSFGIKPLYWFWYIIGFILSPIKLLDIFLNNHPMAEQIASVFAIEVRKK